jgi:hypothetical protein
VPTRDIRINSPFSLVQHLLAVNMSSYEESLSGSTPASSDTPVWAQRMFGLLEEQMSARLEAIELRTKELARAAAPIPATSTPVQSPGDRAHSEDHSGGPHGTNPMAQSPKDRTTEEHSGVPHLRADDLLGLLQRQQRKRLPDPAPYEGKRSEFRPWLAQVWAKLSVDMASEPGDVRFWYVHSRLRGAALGQITPWVSAIIDQKTTLNDAALDGLIQQLRNAYDDPESAGRAVRQLNVLQQGTNSFAKYLARFEHLLLQAGGLAWDDTVKKAFLSRGLTSEIQRTLLATAEPASYADYCSQLHMVSQRLESMRQREKREWRPAGRTTTQAPVIDNMDWEPTKSTQAAAVRSEKSQPARGSAEKKKRKDTRACFKCGKVGHLVRDCDESYEQESTQKVSLSVAEVKDESSSDDDSGKE